MILILIILRFVDGKVVPAEELANKLRDNKQRISHNVGDIIIEQLLTCLPVSE